MQIKKFPKICNYVVRSIPVDTGRKLNVHKMFSGRPGRVLNVLYTFNLLTPCVYGDAYTLTKEFRRL